MNRKSIVIAVSLVVVFAAAAIAWQFAHAARIPLESKCASLAAGRTEFEAESRRLEENLARAEMERAGLQSASADARKSRPVDAPAAREKSPGLVDPMDAVARDPKLQVLYLASRRAAFSTTYGPLLRALALSPAQVEDLRAAMLSAEEQKQDIAAVMREKEMASTDPAIAAMKARVDEELRAAESRILGVSGFEKLQEYEHNSPARVIVQRFAGAAALGDVPLNARQAEELVQSIAAASGRTPDGAQIDTSNVDWNLVDEKALGILSGDQLALFKSIEPIGGGPSRWISRFNQVLMQAVKSSPPASTPGG